MKIRIIRENKKNILSEGPKLAKDLPEEVFVRIEKWSDAAEVYYSDSEGNRLNQGSKVHGEVKISKTIPGKRDCIKDAWIVEIAQAAKGWGPLLYEVALEFSTKNGKGLTSDRFLVSQDAKGVWDKYLDRSGSVKATQMDISKHTNRFVFGDENKIPQITPDDETDDCGQAISIFYDSGKGNWKEEGNNIQKMKNQAKENPFESEWYNQSVSKIYTKPNDTATQSLKAINKLIEE